jgi:hypothetical protein
MGKIIETLKMTLTEGSDKINIQNLSTGKDEISYLEMNTIIKKYGEKGYKLTVIDRPFNISTTAFYYFVREL